MFTSDLAESYKESAGQKYQPSNGTEGMIFMERYCDNCIHDDGEDKLCNLIADTMIYEPEDEEYPQEWQYGKDGQPLCTKFENEKE